MNGPRFERRERWAHVALLIALGAGVYLGTLSYPFHYDDWSLIVADPAIQKLWPIGGHPNRPVHTLGLALNNRIFGMDAAYFRLVNIAIHISAALVLYGLVRRTLLLGTFSDRTRSSSAKIAFAVAALWVVHPLQTMSVTYIWQRCESLMSLFLLLLLYCTVRASEGRRVGLWTAAVLLCFALGLGTKEVMLAAVPVVLLYDGILLAPSLRDAVRRRPGIHATLGLVAIGITIVVLARTHTSSGFVDRWTYAANQPGVILDYLALAVWPATLCFDYARLPLDGALNLWASALAVFAMLGAAFWFLKRRSWIGVALAAFFLILAPTSSFVPINDLMVEYRMYLPLAALIALGVALGRRLSSAFGVPAWALLVVCIAALSARTVQRNRDYRDNVTLWSTVVEQAPHNLRGHYTLGVAYLEAGRPAEAIPHFEYYMLSKPNHRRAHRNLGMALHQTGDLEGAVEHYLFAVRKRRTVRGHVVIGDVMLELGDLKRAARHYLKALELNGERADVHRRLAFVRRKRGRPERALRSCERALELDPNDREAWILMARLSVELENVEKAIAAYDRALLLDPEDASLQCEAGRLRAVTGDDDPAFLHFEQGLRLAPELALQVSELATAAARGPYEEQHPLALRLAELAAQRSSRRNPQILANLARTYAALGRIDLARVAYEEVLSLDEVARDVALRTELERELQACGGTQ